MNEKHIEDANHLAAMLLTPGWKVMQAEIAERTEKLVTALIWSDDDKVKSQIQSNIRGLEFLLKFPLEMMEAAKRATEQEAPSNDGD